MASFSNSHMSLMSQPSTVATFKSTVMLTGSSCLNLLMVHDDNSVCFLISDEVKFLSIRSFQSFLYVTFMFCLLSVMIKCDITMLHTTLYYCMFVFSIEMSKKRSNFRKNKSIKQKRKKRSSGLSSDDLFLYALHFCNS